MKFWEKSALEKTKNKANGTYVAPIFEHVELHQKYDHEHFKLAQLPLYSQMWVYMLQFGKVIFLLIFPISTISHIAVAHASDDSWQQVTVELLIGLYPFLLGIPLLSWLIGHMV
ncbi:hypothetical protein PSYMP_23776, partial [Pseudomonas amygdali pv. morsprunorum str. M302280]